MHDKRKASRKTSGEMNLKLKTDENIYRGIGVDAPGKNFFLRRFKKAFLKSLFESLIYLILRHLSVVISRPSWPPGFMIFFGSKCFLSVLKTDICSLPRCFSIHGEIIFPTP